MLNQYVSVDYVIVGGGIMGLSLARASIAVVEKENKIGVHASGLNSGVLHSGIYYKKGSLKAKFCLEGSRAMAAYCDQHQLPIHRIGKIILSQTHEDGPVLDMLYQRAIYNGAKVSLIDEKEYTMN